MFGKTAKGQGRSTMPLSVIGADVRIVGDIITQGEMQIDGQVEGDITCARLVIGEGGRITGAVRADTIRIHGHVTGTIFADAVKIAKTAQVVGDVTHETMEMEAGGHVEGHLIRKNAAPAAPALEAPRPAIAAPAPATSAAPAPEPKPQPKAKAAEAEPEDQASEAAQ